METLFRIFYLPFLLVVFASCVNSKKQQLGNQEIKNLHNQIVSIDSLETLIKFQMKEMDIPGLSLAIINNSKLVYTTTKGYANTETKQLVNNQTIFECASISKLGAIGMHFKVRDPLKKSLPAFIFLVLSGVIRGNTLA